VPAAVEEVVLHALEKRRDARPQTAGALAVEFTTALHEPSVGLKSPDTGQSNQPPAANLPGPGSVPTMVLTNRSSVQSSFNPALGSSSSISSPIGGKVKTRLVWLIVLGAIVLLGLGGVVGWVLLNNGTPNRETIQRGQTNLTTDPQGGTASPVRITATASSVRVPISVASYQASNTLDGRLNTAWIEGVVGPGIAEWIRFDFDREVDIRGMTIFPGYFKSPEIWAQNNRVAAVSLNFSDGTIQRFRFPDGMVKQTLTLGSVRISSVKIVIEEVYFGKDPDTAISEVSFDFGKVDGASSPSQSVGMGHPSSVSGFDSVEAKIVSGQLIGTSDLARMSAGELQHLRNAVFARHGRMFDTPDLQKYFTGRPWYAPRSDYSDRDLSSTDKVNLNLLIAVEKGAH